MTSRPGSGDHLPFGRERGPGNTPAVVHRADALVAVFVAVGCHPHMVEMHHGVNPRIERLDADRASGHWGQH